jgi:hypothetical protein
MIIGELKTCWNIEPLEINVDGAMCAYEMLLNCEHHHQIQFIYVGQLLKLLQFIKENDPSRLKQIKKLLEVET